MEGGLEQFYIISACAFQGQGQKLITTQVNKGRRDLNDLINEGEVQPGNVQPLLRSKIKNEQLNVPF